MQAITRVGHPKLQVRSYDLYLDMDLATSKFSGKVAIDLESEENVRLDAVDLNIVSVKADGKTVPFKASNTGVEVQTARFTGRLDIDYGGTIQDGLTGIYRASYGEGFVVSTHFEAAHARKLLPCVDNPSYKAGFKLTVRVDKDLSVISNMPVEGLKHEDGKKIVSFQKTPKMSTYLLYLGIGKFVEDHERMGGVDIVAATVPRGTVKSKTEFPLEAARKSLEFYNAYFNIPYDLPKLHLVGVPEFAYGAMENWGAITFREIFMHVDKDTSVRAKKNVAIVVAHEIAHMWFGDLVTMKWWDDLWLNESFATFMSFKAVDKIYPQWQIWQDFLRTQTTGSMARDSLRNTHPIEAKVHVPEEIEELFDEISYGKGASVLRMVEAYIGTENFMKGVRNYLNEYRFSNAAGQDFWKHLDQESGSDVSRIMHGWIANAGFPVVTASLISDKLSVKQERFLLSGETEKKRWPIPLTLAVNGQVRQSLLDKEEDKIDVGKPKSLKLNIDQTGFYRVFYQGKNLADLVWAGKLSTLDRYGLVSDAFAFLVSGRMPYKDYLNVISKYHNEQDYLPAFELSDQLFLLYDIAPKTSATSRRFHASQLKLLGDKKDENSSLLRGVMAVRLALIDDNYAKEVSTRFEEVERVEPDMRRAVTVGYARSTANFERLLSGYRKASTDEERLRYLEALVSLKDPSLIGLALGLALSGDVKKQDIANIVLYATANPDAKNITWTWLKMNIERLDKLYQGTAQFSSLLRNTIPILGVGKLREVEKFFSDNKVVGADIAIERLRIYDRLARSITE